MRRAMAERGTAVRGEKCAAASRPPFRLDPVHGVGRIRADFAARRRVQIPDFLAPECAAALLAELRGRGDWHQIVNSGANVYDLDRATRARLSPHEAAALDEAVYAGARTGFQHRYEAIRVPDAQAERDAS